MSVFGETRRYADGVAEGFIKAINEAGGNIYDSTECNFESLSSDTHGIRHCLEGSRAAGRGVKVFATYPDDLRLALDICGEDTNDGLCNSEGDVWISL